jgi:hypothetical protein
MNNELLAFETKKRLQVESRETLTTRKQQTGWKKERDLARDLRRERERTTNKLSRSQNSSSPSDHIY